MAQEWEVEAMPTFLFLRGGKIVDKLVGASKEKLLAIATKHAAPAAAVAAA